MLVMKEDAIVVLRLANVLAPEWLCLRTEDLTQMGAAERPLLK